MAGDVRIVMDARAFLAGLKELESRTETAMERAADDGADAAIASVEKTTLFKDQTGRLRGRIRKGGSGFKRTVTDPMPYASYVNDGTEPHDIVAKNGGTLRFMVNGEWIYRRKVHHPWTQPRPFMDLAAAVGWTSMYAGLEKRLSQAIRRFDV